MSRAGTAYLVVEPDFSKLNKEMASKYGQLDRKYGTLKVDVKTNPAANAALKRQAKTLREIGTAAKYAAAGTALLGGAGVVSAISTAANFQQQISRLGAVAGASARQMKTLQQQAIKAGAATKFSALDAAKAQTELAKGGLSVQQIMSGGLKSALALAAAGELDLADAASTTVNAMKLFSLNGKDSMVVADALATAANKTTADVSDFALALKMGGSVAKLAGLSFNDTVVALEALAEAGIKGSDAGTSLKSFFLNIATPGKKSAEAMKDLGVNIFDAQGRLKTLPAISKNLRTAFGSLTKEQFLQKAGTIAGSDAIRTLYSLYAAGPSKLEKLAAATAKHGTAAEVSAKKQTNLKGALENLKGSFETLEISVGTMALPGLTKFSKRLTEVVNQISAISTRKDLDFGEKIHLSMQKLGREFGPDVKNLHIDKVLGEAISKGASFMGKEAAKAAPKAVAAFFNAWRGADAWGKLVIGGFLLHKIGGLAAFRALGKQTGTAMGSSMAEAAAVAEATGSRGKPGSRPLTGTPTSRPKPVVPVSVPTATGGAVVGRLRTQFTKVAPQLRAAAKATLGVALMSGIADAATRQGISGAGPRLQQAISTITLGAFPAPKTIDQRMQSIMSKIAAYKGRIDLSQIFRNGGAGFSQQQQQIAKTFANARNMANALQRDLAGKHRIEVRVGSRASDFVAITNNFGKLNRGALASVRDLERTTDANFALIQRTMGTHSKAGATAVGKNMHDALHGIKIMVSSGQISTRQGMKEIARLMSTNSHAGKEAVGTNFAEAVGFIRKNMKSGKSVTKEGMDYIRKVFVAEAKMFGLSPGAASALANEQAFQVAHQHTNLGGRQRGGHITGGAPSGDSIPAMLERDEYVLNRKAVRKVGRRNLDALNFGDAPRFQRGGPVGYQGGGFVNNVGAHIDTPAEKSIAADLAKLGKKLGIMFSPVGARSARRTPSENAAVGGAGNSHHLSGQAMDVAPDSVKSIANSVLHSVGLNRPMPGNWTDGSGSVHDERNHIELIGLGTGGTGDGSGGGGATFKEIARSIVKGPDSPLKSIMQQSLDASTGFANTRLKKLAGSVGDAGQSGGGGGGGGVPSFSGSWHDRLVQLAHDAGWSVPDWDWIISHESGGNPNATNPSSGAYGLGQFLGSTKAEYAQYGATSPDPSKQIYAMYRYIKDRYGTSSNAKAFWEAHNWYSKGGPVKVGYTTYNDPPPGAFGSLTDGYAELGTAKRTDGSATGKGWIAKAMGLGGELPAHKVLSVMINKKIKKLQKGDRGYGQGGNGTTSDSRYAIDIWKDSWAKFGIGATSKGTATVSTGAMATSSPKTTKKTPTASINAPKHGKGTNSAQAAPPLPTFGSEAMNAMVGYYNQAGNHAEDLETFYQQADSSYNLDSILTQDELDQLLWRIEQPTTDGIVQIYSNQMGLGQQIVGNFKQTVAAAQRIVKDQVAKVQSNLKKITAWKAELKKVTKKKNADVVDIRAIDRLRHPKAADMKKRADLVKEVHSLEGKEKALGKDIDGAQMSNLKLYGVKSPDSPSSDGSGARTDSQIGRRVEQITNITEAGDSISENLRPQGIPSSIFNWQQTAAQLRQDGATKPDNPDDAGGTSDNSSALVSDLQAALTEANLRTAVSETELRVLGAAGSIPPFGGSFATGGTVPGPIGAARTIIAHGGEEVFNPALGGSGTIRVIVEDGAVDPNKIRVIAGDVVQQVTRTQARRGGRALPGRAGSLV